MQKDRQYYNEFYKVKDENVHNESERLIKISQLCNGSVLDVGCGTGNLAEYYNGKYTGIDISDVAIGKAKTTRRGDVRFLVKDISSPHIVASEKYDSIVFGEILEHIDDDLQAIEKAIKWLSPNGKIIVSVPNSDRIKDESHVRIYTVPEIRKKFKEYGVITFCQWNGFEKRIIFTIEPDRKKEEEISLVMILKDEEKGLEKALLSVIEYVDNIVLSIDESSSDKTEEIARLYADELKKHTWENDFSKARNKAQENVKTKWIIFLDGHEYVKDWKLNDDDLKKEIDGILVTIQLENGMTFLFPRIYRSHITFKGAVHNLNTCDKKIFRPNFVIVHDRINLQSSEAIEARNKQRDEMLPKIMLERIKEDKGDCRALFHLGNYYLMKKDYKKAIKYYKQHLKYSDNNEEKYLMALNLGMARQMLGNNLFANFAYAKAEKYLPGRWETARLIGANYLIMGRYKKAMEWLVQALGENPRKYIYNPIKKDYAVIWDMIGTALERMEQYAKAIIAFQRAKEMSESDISKKYYEQKIALVGMLVKK